MKRFGAVAMLWAVLAGAPGLAAAATCPIGVPVVHLPHGPHPSGFNWSARPSCRRETNKGVTWKLLRTFEREISSILARPVAVLPARR